MHIENKVTKKSAIEEYKILKQTFTKLGAGIQEIQPEKDVPDMVYTANLGYIKDNLFIPANFKYRERQKESIYSENYFRNLGYKIKKLPAEINWEGEGDFLTVGNKYFMGHGKRSDIRAAKLLSKILNDEVIPLKLIDPFFYHLDMCFFPLDETTIVINPRSFEPIGLKTIRQHFKTVIESSPEDNKFMGCNAEIIEKTIVVAQGISGELKNKYASLGYATKELEMDEYRKGGGSIKCCAYQFSATPEDDIQFNDKLLFKDGLHFSMGSWMVLSLNCPRAAYKADHDDEKLFVELKKLMYNATEVFRIKRRWMDKLIERNRIPFASQRPKDPHTGQAGAQAVDFEALVYTIGVIGINEMIQYHTGKQIHESPDAYKLAIRTMFELKQYARKLEQENGITLALARTPAETTAQRFAVSDLLHAEFADKAKEVIKGDLVVAERDIRKTRDLPIYYTNGTHISPGADVSLPERIRLEQTFFPIVDGGNIMHIWLGESNPDPDGLQELAMHIAKNTQTGYFAFTRDMTVCTHEGYVTSGLLEICPKCGSNEVQHLSRITGYLQSVEGWNKGKRQELLDRKRYDIR